MEACCTEIKTSKAAKKISADKFVVNIYKFSTKVGYEKPSLHFYKELAHLKLQGHN